MIMKKKIIALNDRYVLNLFIIYLYFSPATCKRKSFCAANIKMQYLPFSINYIMLRISNMARSGLPSQPTLDHLLESFKIHDSYNHENR